MQTQRGPAVAACPSREGVEALLRALAQAGFEPAGSACDAEAAMALVRRVQPALLLADAVLPGTDGPGLALRIAREPLNARPWVLIARSGGMRLPGWAALADIGAGILEKPVTAEAIAAGLDGLNAKAPLLPAFRAERLNRLLDALGVPAHPGRDMLFRAVGLCWRDRRRLDNLRDRIYPQSGAPFGKTAAQAERAIRHAIDVAWRTGEIEQQQRIFGNTIDARRGRPTCGEMIAQLADILRWEG